MCKDDRKINHLAAFAYLLVEREQGVDRKDVDRVAHQNHLERVYRVANTITTNTLEDIEIEMFIVCKILLLMSIELI